MKKLAIVTFILVIFASAYLVFNTHFKNNLSQPELVLPNKPYRIALVNEDEGGKLNQEDYQFGLYFLNKLSKDSSQDWTVMTRILAENALKEENVDAIIYINKDFSKKLLQINDEMPQSINLDYTISTQHDDLMKIRLVDKVESYIDSMNEDINKVYISTILTQLDKAKVKLEQNYMESSSFVKKVKIDLIQAMEDEKSKIEKFSRMINLPAQSKSLSTENIEQAVGKVNQILERQNHQTDHEPKWLHLDEEKVNERRNNLTEEIGILKNKLIEQREKVVDYFMNPSNQTNVSFKWISQKLEMINAKLSNMNLDLPTYQKRLTYLVEEGLLSQEKKDELERQLSQLRAYAQFCQLPSSNNHSIMSDLVYEGDVQIDLSRVMTMNENNSKVEVRQSEQQGQQLELNFKLVKTVLHLHYQYQTNDPEANQIDYTIIINQEEIPVSQTLESPKDSLHLLSPFFSEVNQINEDLELIFNSPDKTGEINFSSLSEDSLYQQYLHQSQNKDQFNILGEELLSQIDETLNTIEDNHQKNLYKREEVNQFEDYYSRLLPLLQSKRFNASSDNNQVQNTELLKQLHKDLVQLSNQNELPISKTYTPNEVEQLIDGVEQTLSTTQKLTKGQSKKIKEQKDFSDTFQKILQHAKKDGVSNQEYIDFLSHPIESEGNHLSKHKSQADYSWQWVTYSILPLSVLAYLLLNKVFIKIHEAYMD